MYLLGPVGLHPRAGGRACGRAEPLGLPGGRACARAQARGGAIARGRAIAEWEYALTDGRRSPREAAAKLPNR